MFEHPFGGLKLNIFMFLKPINIGLSDLYVLKKKKDKNRSDSPIHRFCETKKKSHHRFCETKKTIN